jgi:hypothetical protein
MLASQTRSLADQVRLQVQQTDVLAKQTELQAEQYEILASATELQFNLDVMVRLQDVLFTVADDDASYSEVWGDLADNRRPKMAGDALLDVVAMALKACARLPNFASNVDDWKSYTEYLVANSSSLRARALAHPEWWPEVTPYAQKAHAPSGPPSSEGPVVIAAQIRAARTIVDYDKTAGRKTSRSVRKVANSVPRDIADSEAEGQ